MGEANKTITQFHTMVPHLAVNNRRGKVTRALTNESGPARLSNAACWSTSP